MTLLVVDKPEGFASNPNLLRTQILVSEVIVIVVNKFTDT